jgi:EF hand
MKIALILTFTAAVVSAQQGPSGPVRMSVIRSSPILNILDVNQDGIISATELADAQAQLIKLDKNGDGKLSLEEAGM